MSRKPSGPPSSRRGPGTLEERIRARLGLRVPDTARNAIIAMLSEHADRNSKSVADLLAALSWSGDSTTSAHALAEVVTSRHTHFFRDHSTLQLICDMLAATPKPAHELPVLWCAGCASGEEPYTLAMLLNEMAVEVNIIATDVNVAALGRARAGIYDVKALQHVPQPLRERYFVPQADGTSVKVVRSLRDRIRFELGELFTNPYPRNAPPPDVIACRNVLLYYDDEFAARALRRLASTLYVGGLLFVAASDLLSLRDTPGFRRRRDLGVGIFERTDDEIIPSDQPPQSRRFGAAPRSVRSAQLRSRRGGDGSPRSVRSAQLGRRSDDSGPGSVRSAQLGRQQSWRTRDTLDFSKPASSRRPFDTIDFSKPSSSGSRRPLDTLDFSKVPPPRRPLDTLDFSASLGPPASADDAPTPRSPDVAAPPTSTPVSVAPPSDGLSRWLSEACQALDRHDFEKARKSLRTATERAPAAPEPWLLLGVIARKTGDIDEALAQLRRALFLSPQLWPASLLLAGVWNRCGEKDRARSQYRATLKMLDRVAAAKPPMDGRPSPVQPLARLTRIWSQMPTPEQARQLCLRRAGDPADP